MNIATKFSISCISGIVPNMWLQIWTKHDISKCPMDEIHTQMYTPYFDHIIIYNNLPWFATIILPCGRVYINLNYEN